MGSDPRGTPPAPPESWRSLEPASLLVNLVPDLWRTARGAWPLLLAVLVGGGVANLVNLGLLGFFLLLAGARTVLHFLTLRYRMNAGKLEIRTGVLATRFRVIDPARIQNVEIVQNVFHKLAGLVELRIETAGDAGVEGLLSALSVSEANALREQLHSGQAAAGRVAAVPAGEDVLALSLAELVGYGVSAGRVGAVVLAGGVAMEVLGQLSPNTVSDTAGNLRPGAAFGLALLALAAGYTLSVGNTILRHYGFRLVRSDRGLRFEAGLFTRRGVEIPPGKVQLVRVDEPWLRRWMGYGTLGVETAASGAPGEAPTAEGLLPMVPAEDFAAVVGLILPGLDIDAWAAPLVPAAPRALVRAMVGGAIRWGGAGGLLTLWLGGRSLAGAPGDRTGLLVVVGVVAAVLAAAGALLAWLEWRRQGWRLTDRFVVARRGLFTRRTWILPRAKIQSVHLHAGPILRRYGLARVVVWVAGSSVGLPIVRAADAATLFTALAQRPVEAGVPGIEVVYTAGREAPP